MPVTVVAVLLLGAGIAVVGLRNDPPDPDSPARKTSPSDLPARVRDPRAVLRDDQDAFAHLEPGETRVMHVEADRDLVAVLNVFPTTGAVQVATMLVRTIELTPEEENALERSYREVRPKNTVQLHQEAKAGEVVECFVRNPGAQPVGLRIRLRWWSLGEPPPPREPEELTKTETIPPGERLEAYFQAGKSSEWAIDVTPKIGAVKVTLLEAESCPLGDAERSRVPGSMILVPAPHSETLKRRVRIGRTLYFCVLNPGTLPVTVDLKYRLTGVVR
jgi:hypothetical protein